MPGTSGAVPSPGGPALRTYDSLGPGPRGADIPSGFASQSRGRCSPCQPDTASFLPGVRGAGGPLPAPSLEPRVGLCGCLGLGSAGLFGAEATPVGLFWVCSLAPEPRGRAPAHTGLRHTPLVGLVRMAAGPPSPPATAPQGRCSATGASAPAAACASCSGRASARSSSPAARWPPCPPSPWRCRCKAARALGWEGPEAAPARGFRTSRAARCLQPFSSLPGKPTRHRQAPDLGGGRPQRPRRSPAELCL